MLIRRDRAMLAVTVMLDIAFHGGRTATVSAADMADRLGLARRGMEPLLQALSRAGLLVSVRGPRGGYRVGRPPRDIPLAEIVGIAIGSSAPASGGEGAEGPVGRLQTDVVDPLWADVDAAARAPLVALTLEDLLKRSASAGLRRPASEPITFAI